MTPKQPKIALVNVWTDQNRGDAAIVVATYRLIRQLYPDALIEFHNVAFGARDMESQKSKHFSLYERENYKIHPALFPSMIVQKGEVKVSRISRVLYFLRAIVILCLAFLSRPLGKLLLSKDEKLAYENLTLADLVVSKGGSYLLGNSWKDFIGITMVLFPMVLASICGCKTILLGVSVGPARSPLSAFVMYFWLKWVDRIVVRENEGYKTCLRIGVPENRLSVLPDVAFSLVLSEQVKPRIPDIFEDCPRPLIGVTVRRWLFDDIGDCKRREKNYLDSVAYALGTFQQKIGGTVILVPQVIDPLPEGSDIGALDCIQKALGASAKIIRIGNEQDYNSLRAIYANLDILIATRLHSAILGFGTPTVIIGYQGDKSIGTARLMGCESAYVHINDITGCNLLEKIELVWWGRNRIRLDLEKIKLEFLQQFQSKLPQLLSVD